MTASCGICKEPGATLEVEDAEGKLHVVHRACWLALSGAVGEMARQAKRDGRRIFGLPRLQKKTRGGP